MASSEKIRNTDKILDERKYDKGKFVHAILTLCYDMDTKSPVLLAPLKMNVCNAATSNGTTFSKAFCDTEQYDECYMFGDIFLDGVEVLSNYIENNSLPKDRQWLFVFQKLLDFLNGSKYT